MSLTVDSRHRWTRVVARAASVCSAASIVLLTLWLWAAPTASGLVAGEADALDRIDILGVRAGDPTQVLFAAPSRLMTRTLTSDDVTVTVDGAARPARLQRLSATDLEVAVVIDTTVDEDDLRTVQGAVVELALDLPPGATMRIVDAAGTASEPAPVPGPAIAQIRQLQAGSVDNLQRGVAEATALLARSGQDRTALLVIGRDLGARLDPIDEAPLDTTVAYVVDIGAGGTALLGAGASGTVIAAGDTDDVLPAVDEMSVDLRNLYLAEVALPVAGARTLTLDIPAAGGDATGITVELDPDSVRPVEAEPAVAPEDPDPRPPAAGDDTAVPTGEPAAISLPRVVAPLGFALIALAVLALLWIGVRRLRDQRRDRTVSTTFTATDPPIASGAPRADRPQRPTRPIAKLAPETREALARAHLGLRRLALASRAVTDRVPDHLFRLSEARASVALAGRDVPFDDVLAAELTDPPDGDDVAAVRRAATALSTGWQHTARRKATPPPVVEISAVLTGQPSDGGDPPRRPLAPVRALNPLVEIGLEHVMLASHSGPHSELVARAVAAVEIARAARLSRPFLALSPRLRDDAGAYRRAIGADLSDAQQRDGWLQLLCSAVALASGDCADQVTRLDQIRGRYRDQADDPRLLPLIDLIVAQPMLDIDLVMRRLSASHDAASGLLSQAGDAGWLQPHPRLPAVLIAEQVIALFRRSDDKHEHDSQPVS